MLHMLRTESTSGAIQDLAHIRTHHCLSDCLTKNNAKPDNLIAATQTGILPDLDANPMFREMIKHMAFLCEWLFGLPRETNEPIVYFLDNYVLHDYVRQQQQRVRSACVARMLSTM
jgi:hypothetical protein